MSKIYRCLQAVAFERPDGTSSVVTADQVVAADDPMFTGRQDLLAREDLFEPFEEYAARRAGVEQATAAPGEKRTVRTPAAKKTTGGKGDPDAA